MLEQEFRDRCLEHGLALTDGQMEQFEKYRDLLITWNEKMNLTAITEEADIWEKHFYDSLLPFFGMDLSSLCDVGTGAGFPGIPCKITWPDLDLVLVEPLAKRCRFLKEVVDVLGLSRVAIENVRAEDYAKANRDKFAVVTSRAVARLSILLELCAPLVATGGLVVAMKGPGGPEELRRAEPALSTLHLVLDKEETLTENGITRINYLFKKTGKTPAKYPRNFGQIKRTPLEVD